ncbi:hypothetical protein [Thalassobaculum sp.]|uniref:DUF6963 family protein n=1 Tax=Thalassobaculum sp. TaxID=2022740 RepID=UPI0032EDE3EA
MTIGIAAFGPSAGEAVLAGLGTVESVGVGEIRGFGVFAALCPDGTLVRARTQRGGGSVMLADLGRQGVLSQAEAATVAAVISSGPDRPEPLDQFLPGSPAGLVTGHRLPNTPGADGVPLNLAVLQRIGAGEAPVAAVQAVIDANPEVDAGLIAVSKGALSLGETRRVERRNDRGQARLDIRDGTAGVAVLHNAIQPFEGLALLAAGAARAVLEAALPLLARFRIEPGITLEAANADGVWLTADGRVERVASANPGHPHYQGWTSSAIYLGTPVYQHGHRIGVTVGEARCRLDRGRVAEVDPERSSVTWRP